MLVPQDRHRPSGISYNGKSLLWNLLDLLLAPSSFSQSFSSNIAHCLIHSPLHTESLNRSYLLQPQWRPLSLRSASSPLLSSPSLSFVQPLQPRALSTPTLCATTTTRMTTSNVTQNAITLAPRVATIFSQVVVLALPNLPRTKRITSITSAVMLIDLIL